jgi:hypothetical protein
VDTDSIKRKMNEELREAFARYLALRRERSDPAGTTEVRAALRKATAGDLHDLVSLTLPKNETNELLESLVRRLRDEYVESPEHGLDKYLSVRIRHGTLAAHLRRPAEAANLVTTRVAGGKAYKRNEYWPDRLSIAGKDADHLTERLSEFSRDFDKLIDDVKSWIQVTKDGAGTGLFDFSLNEAQLRLFAELVRPDMTFEDFVDYLLEQFGALLDKDLERAREKLRDVGKIRAGAVLDKLAADVDRFGDRIDVGDLVNAIRTARTDIQVAFDRVGEWFRRAKAIANEPFSVNDAIEISAETVRTVAPRFIVDVNNVGDESLPMAGELLAIFVDIFFIIFENIARHAGLPDAPRATVLVTWQPSTLEVVVENGIGPNVASKEARARVAAIQAAIAQQLDATSVSREGGTGFHKLARLLGHDLGIDPNLQFGFLDTARFVVSFSLPVVIRDKDPASR